MGLENCVALWSINENLIGEKDEEEMLFMGATQFGGGGDALTICC